jgi:hypothetical protein
MRRVFVCLPGPNNKNQSYLSERNFLEDLTPTRNFLAYFSASRAFVFEIFISSHVIFESLIDYVPEKQSSDSGNATAVFLCHLECISKSSEL